MRVVIVSGSSGSGKSSALNQLEDLGYYCVDNLPIALVSVLIEHFSKQSHQTHQGLAICIDIRTQDAGVTDFRDYLRALREGARAPAHIFLMRRRKHSVNVSTKRDADIH